MALSVLQKTIIKLSKIALWGKYSCGLGALAGNGNGLEMRQLWGWNGWCENLLIVVGGGVNDDDDDDGDDPIDHTRADEDGFDIIVAFPIDAEMSVCTFDRFYPIRILLLFCLFHQSRAVLFCAAVGCQIRTHDG